MSRRRLQFRISPEGYEHLKAVQREYGLASLSAALHFILKRDALAHAQVKTAEAGR